MFLQQTQLFWGLSPEFVKKVMSLATSVSLQAGDIIFKKNDPADFFYILIKGQIRICPIEVTKTECCCTCTGESFGWDSLVEQPRYRSTAICVEPAVLLKLSRMNMNMVLEEDPYSATLFFRHLAAALGDCLMQRWMSTSNEQLTEDQHQCMVQEFA